MRPLTCAWRRLTAVPVVRSVPSSFSACHGCTCTAALVSQKRLKSFHFYMNLDDPEDTRRHVEEELERLTDNHKRDTSAYLHSLLNLSLSYYQAQDYIKAREFAEYTHQKARDYNSKSSFLFLTSTTCANCCAKLADEYAQHVEEAEARSHASASLAPRPSVVFSAKRAIRKLREDATRYEGIAARIHARPDMAFMKGLHNAPVNPKRRQAYYGEASGTGSDGDGDGAETHKDEDEDVRSSQQRGGTTPPRRRGRQHHGLGWGEDANNVDEEYEAEYFGDRWQKQRRRPEHAELKRYYQRHNAGSSGRYRVPK